MCPVCGDQRWIIEHECNASLVGGWGEGVGVFVEFASSWRKVKKHKCTDCRRWGRVGGCRIQEFYEIEGKNGSSLVFLKHTADAGFSTLEIS